MRTIRALFVASTALILGAGNCGKEEPKLPAPTLRSITPAVGDIAGGQVVTIRGAELGSVSGVSFGGVPASAVTPGPDGTSLTALTPAHERGVVTVAVTNAGGTAELQGAFSYVRQAVITALEPSRVPANTATSVTLRGSGLVPPLTARITDNAAFSASAVVGPGTDLAVPLEVPALEVGQYTITVTNGENQVATAPQPLIVTPPIRVTEVDPPMGFADESTFVKITGTGFEGVTTVLLGTAPCVNLAVNPTELSCDVPPGVAGPVDVVVRRTPGDEARVTNGFTYHSSTDATVRVLYADPRQGRSTGGTTIDIAATGLGAGTPTVTIAGAAATVVQVIDGKRARVNLPAFTIPTSGEPFTRVAVSVTVNGQSDTRQNAFTYYLRPAFASINPTRGATVGTDLVTIFGEGFTAEGMRVLFGLNNEFYDATDVSRLSPTRLSCRIPSHAAGRVNVVLISRFDASDQQVDAFEYVEAVRVTRLEPPTASIAGGTVVTAIGSGFVPGQGRMEVTVGGTDTIQNPEVLSNSRMRFVVPRRQAPGPTVLRIRDVNSTDSTIAIGEINIEYQNKTVPQGGVGGGAIGPEVLPATSPATFFPGNISVSVIRQDTGAPISGAEVFLGDSWSGAQFRRTTDDRGMTVIAGTNLRGPVTITAARTSFENQTRVGLNASEITFALLPHLPEQPPPEQFATISGGIANWAQAGLPLGAAPGQVKRLAVVWLSEADQGIYPPPPGNAHIVAEEPCDITPDGAFNPLPTQFTINARPNTRAALMAVVYFYDSRNGVCEPGSPQQPSQEGEGLVGVTAGAIGILPDIMVGPGTNPGYNIPVNRTVTDGLQVNLVGAPALGGVGATARSVDAILDVGPSGVFTFVTPFVDQATFGMGAALPLIGFLDYQPGDFMNVLPTAIPAPGGDLKYIMHGYTGLPVYNDQNQMVGLQPPQTEVWKRGVVEYNVNLDGWFQLPSALSPTGNAALQDRTFRWAAFTRQPSFITLDVGEVDQSGNIIPRWSVLLPAGSTEFRVPDLAGAQNASDLTPGQNLWQVGAYSIFAEHAFDYSDHTNDRLAEPYWEARVLSGAESFNMP